MPSDANPSTEDRSAPLSAPGALPRLAVVGTIILAVIVGFLYLGGWFSPHDLTPARFVDGFERAAGVHSGFRRNHAKGLCASGFFDSNGDGTRLSKAVVFRTGRVPVIGRFSFGGGNPDIADAPETIRGLGLRFLLPDGEEWRMAMINRPVFPFNTPQAFYDNLIASRPEPDTHKPDPQKIAAFAASHPEFVQAVKIIQSHQISSDFDNATFYGLNAFRFISADGVSTPVRWSMVPMNAFKPEDTTQSANPDKNYLFDDLIARIHSSPVQWRLILTVGQSGDPTNDATIPWPEEREHVDAGTLTLDQVEAEARGNCRDINFDPLVLPSGIAPSDDPLLSARSAVYSQSFTRRASETKEPSAIAPSEVQK